MNFASLDVPASIRPFSSRWIISALLSTFIALASGSLHAQPAATLQSEIVRLKPRGEVEQAYLLIRESSSVKAIAVLLTGGYGLLKYRVENSEIVSDPQGRSFLTINQNRFVDSETAVAVIDAPTDQWGIGYTPRFRKSDTHANDMRAVVRDLRVRLPGARIYLIGTSQGTTSAAYAGKALGSDIDGIVLTGSVFEWAPASWRFLYDSNLSDFDFARISVPLLMVHHADDRCIATPYSAAIKFADKYPFITVRGGEPVRDNGCGPNGPHGFLGQEEAVVREIKNWMYGRPFQREIR